MLMRALSVHTAHETAGAARIRHSLRPLDSERAKSFQQSSRENARRDREVMFFRHCERSDVSADALAKAEAIYLGRAKEESIASSRRSSQ
jgi:hypothetical protein